MIKALLRTPGARPDVVVFGLSAQNIARLEAGQPVRANLADLGLPALHVVILAGDNEETMREDMLAHLARTNIPVTERNM